MAQTIGNDSRAHPIPRGQDRQTRAGRPGRHRVHVSFCPIARPSEKSTGESWRLNSLLDVQRRGSQRVTNIVEGLGKGKRNRRLTNKECRLLRGRQILDWRVENGEERRVSADLPRPPGHFPSTIGTPCSSLSGSSVAHPPPVIQRRLRTISRSRSLPFESQVKSTEAELHPSAPRRSPPLACSRDGREHYTGDHHFSSDSRHILGNKFPHLPSA